MELKKILDQIGLGKLLMNLSTLHDYRVTLSGKDLRISN